MAKHFKFSEVSLNNLKGVHPDLVKVVTLALHKSTVDFRVIEGLRTKERQRDLFAKGASQTMNSRHITGHAVDCAPWINGTIPWKDKPKFKAISDAMFEAAKELGVHIRWGGDWNENGRSDDERFYDGPHFELSRKEYP
ncbi:M15 family metallopeptidase [Thorsellia kenyensis]|uniref:M15 family metallopeptidase n=1 Tax=Thorsellia kenyensis TaxID=1549888 RepID=A0ABV6C7P3_9GAMM